MTDATAEVDRDFEEWKALKAAGAAARRKAERSQPVLMPFIRRLGPSLVQFRYFESGGDGNLDKYTRMPSEIEFDLPFRDSPNVAVVARDRPFEGEPPMPLLRARDVGRRGFIVEAVPEAEGREPFRSFIWMAMGFRFRLWVRCVFAVCSGDYRRTGCLPIPKNRGSALRVACWLLRVGFR